MTAADRCIGHVGAWLGDGTSSAAGGGQSSAIVAAPVVRTEVIRRSTSGRRPSYEARVGDQSRQLARRRTTQYCLTVSGYVSWLPKWK
jgi:hypothetical protein